MDYTFSGVLKRKIMRRVYAVWFFKKVLPMLVLELILLIFLVAKSRELVFWAKVLGNANLAAANLYSLVVFVTLAVSHTRLVVDAVLLGLLGTAAFLARDFIRTVRQFSLILQ